MQEQAQNRFLYRMKSDGSGRERVIGKPITFLVNVSPDERWAVLWGGTGSMEGTVLLPLAGGEPQFLCLCNNGQILQDSPRIAWSGDGKLLYASGEPGETGTIVIPWRDAETLATAASAPNQLERIPGSRVLRETSIAPGPTGARYAFARQTEQSNLFRIRFPD